MRVFQYIMVGQILEELKNEGLPLTRVTFYRLETRMKKRGFKFPEAHRTIGNWRTYTREQADTIKEMIKKNYNIQ